MEVYNGTQIVEHGVLIHNITFSILFLVFIFIFGLWFHYSLSIKNPKEKQHLKKLKKKSLTAEIAKKQLKKIARKNKRRRKRNKENIITNIFIWCLSIGFSVVILSWAIIPGWTDYIKKDYITYTGNITVYNQTKRSRIELEDGTVVWGRGNFDEEDTYGTLVYSKRTKLFLGGID